MSEVPSPSNSAFWYKATVTHIRLVYGINNDAMDEPLHK